MMELAIFYISATVALVATILAMTRSNASHALIYLIMSLLAIAIIFYLIGAPFAAALEVVIYAGAIMVLFVFVIMLLNLGDAGSQNERRQFKPSTWVIPGIMAAVLLLELFVIIDLPGVEVHQQPITPKEVGLRLFGPYVLAVEIASILLLAGLVGAYHVGRKFRLRDEDIQSTQAEEESGR